MPMQLTPGDRKILVITAAVFVVMTAAALMLIRGAGEDRDIPSAYSAASGGCKAAFLLLSEAGYREQTWEQSFGKLPQGKRKYPDYRGNRSASLRKKKSRGSKRF